MAQIQENKMAKVRLQENGMVITKPMLAGEVKSIDELEWPMIATPKVDGIRCLNPDGRILTRSFKPVPNDHIRETLEKYMPVGADGELFSGDTFQKVTSDVMTKVGEPDFKLWLFDYVPDGDLNMPYVDRLAAMLDWYRSIGNEAHQFIKLLPWKTISNVDELKEYEKEVLGKGFEGVILRKPWGPYKCGRSTWREGYLLKLKVFLDSEAEVIGFMEQMSNQNELGTDELGYAKRSTAKAGKVPTGRLGKFLVRDIHTGIEFRVGTGQGLTIELREQIWNNQKQYLGKLIKYKYQPAGVKEKPRIPIWLGFRDERDMS